jgi:hypothetical protein
LHNLVSVLVLKPNRSHAHNVSDPASARQPEIGGANPSG